MSRAAQQLGLGRSAVSKQQAALESSLGARLIQRSTLHPHTDRGG
ncbi:helix-turn-helix domain-containing protein [Teredinibacter turnerae]